MKSLEVRQKFLDFFAARGHHVASSASLVPADPTMLLTGAGMVPFKPIFMGKEEVDHAKVASVQKCVRTTDIELIGKTKRHLSFFEMLGNFSFGDYYKKESIVWAWELLTDVYQVGVDRLWITVFETDDEAAKIWLEDVGVAPERIVRLGEDDNFWAAGPTGPCGPSSEILYDQGADLACGKPTCAPGCDCDRYLELWNLVFMQYNRDETGALHPLPSKNIDTGMGLERIVSVTQGVHSNFDTDLLKPLMDKIAAVASLGHARDESADVSVRIIADHVRAVTFMISDGILPGNDGRGYILRRLIRRAVRHGRLLGVEKAFIPALIDTAVEMMGDAYSELSENRDHIKKVAGREEERFRETLRQGLAILEEVIRDTKASDQTCLSADAAFKLYDTYGFPLELTEEIVQESGLGIDRPGFDALMQAQRDRARGQSGAGHAELFVSNLYHQIKEESAQTEFTGYESIEGLGKIVAIADGERTQTKAGIGEEIDIFLDSTPFYAEKGGQVGDAGLITTETGKVSVLAAIAPVADLIAHKGKVTEGEISLDQEACVEVDGRRRRAISRNHTATHLLHWALRAVLGPQVKQAGSHVDARGLRFDFNHHEALSEDQIRTVENLVNEKILQSQPVRAYETTIDYAKEAGALALFGEKYGRFVRLVEIGNFSKELCGGIHVHNSSEVGYVKIISISSIGADIARIEAVTGEQFLKFVADLGARIEEAAELFGTQPAKLIETIKGARAREAQNEAELERLRREEIKRVGRDILTRPERIEDLTLFVGRVDAADADALRMLADSLRAKEEKAVVVLSSVRASKVLVLIAATKSLVDEGFSAVALIKEVAPIIGGGGGGRADLAQAGGKKIDGIPALLEAAKKSLTSREEMKGGAGRA